MQIFNYPNSSKQQILALGPESNGNFSYFCKNKLYFSEDFGDLLEDANFRKFKKELNKFLKKNNFQPDAILTDLHPLYKTTELGKILAKKLKTEHIQIQHHLAHIFSAIGDRTISNHNSQFSTLKSQISNLTYGIALDGTGYGLDERIWGGEIFEITNYKLQITNKSKISKKTLRIKRIGHLENQIMLGGDLAIKEPARMLIGILSKLLSKKEIFQTLKNLSFGDGRRIMINSRKLYSETEFEVLHNQLQQNFNCIETSSTGRVLDAVSLLLGFCGNERKYKHEPIIALETGSGKPYADIKPRIEILENNQIFNFQFSIFNQFSMTKFPKKYYILNTTFLFKYLIKNLHRDKKRLAATAQLYIAKGIWKIACHSGLEPESSHKASILGSPFNENNIFFAGGIANNKIISAYLESKGAYTNKIIPRGDAGLSFGQIICYLSS